MLHHIAAQKKNTEETGPVKGFNMKKRIATIAIIGAISLFSAPLSAVADQTTPTAKPRGLANEFRASLEKWKSDNKAAMDAYKTAMADYMAKLKANAAARKAANDAFKSAVDAAKSAYKSAITANSTAEAKTAAENARKSAIAAATAARDAAIKAIAALPAKPVKPTLAPKPARPTA